MDDDLVKAAVAVLENAYAPYSKFRVGAAVRGANGKVYVGVNVENASYPQGVCAEAGALSAMVADGERRVVEVAVATETSDVITPCGGCRQKLSEFGSTDTQVHSCGPEGIRKSFTIGGLLPAGFTLEGEE